MYTDRWIVAYGVARYSSSASRHGRSGVKPACSHLILLKALLEGRGAGRGISAVVIGTTGTRPATMACANSKRLQTPLFVT
jgi:hypothetical protein